MLRSYFKIAVRNLINHRVYSLVNIGGLTVGMATSVLIFLWVADELSYDRYHTHADRLYRVGATWKVADQEANYVATPAPLAEFMKRNIPEVTEATRYNIISKALFTYHDRPFQESDGAYTDPATLRMFNFDFVEGDPATALNNPRSVVLSQRLARKYFGSQPAVGQTIRFNDRDELAVSGVYQDLPEASHLRLAYLLPFELFMQNNSISDNNWNDFNYYTYLQTTGSASTEAVGDKMLQLLEKQFGEESDVVDVFLQPITDIHLYSDFDLDVGGHGDIQYVYIFSAIALFILLIACINFMNLATARSMQRAKEIGLRKTIGALRPQLLGQFLGEAILYALIAATLAVLLIKLVLPIYNNLAQKSIDFNLLDPRAIGLLLLVAVLSGLAAGVYPALVLSSFRPAQVLKGTHQSVRGGGLFRKALVVVQFTLSMVLIIGTLVISDQLEFIRDQKLGYDQENTLVVPISGEIGSRYATFRDRLLEQPGVRHVTSASQDLTDVSSTTSGADWAGQTDDGGIILNQLSVDRDFVRAFGITMAEGRAFSPERSADSAAFILNQEAVRQVGLTDPVGTSFSLHGVDGTVVGVAEDFNFQSVHRAIAPLVLFVSPNWRRSLYVKVDQAQLSEAIAAVETTWEQLNPAYPFEYRFLDESFEQLYRAEVRTGALFNYFALIAIFISCLGLFGLSAYTAELRTKEIGVRKVLGASVNSILLLFTRDFVVLVLLAFAVAVPIAYWLMNAWLGGFVYRADISLMVFVVAMVFALAVTLLTVGYQSVQAARANPVDSLRSE